MISGCLLSQIIRVKDLFKERAVKSQRFAYGAAQLFKQLQSTAIWLKLHSKIGLKPIHILILQDYN